MWVLKPFRVRVLLVTAITTGVLGSAVEGTALPVPSLVTAGLGQVPAVALVALLPVAVLTVSWRMWPAPLLASARRPWPLLALAGLSCMCCIPAALVLGSGAGTGTALALARDILGCTGLALVAWRVAGRDPAVAAAPIFLVVCAVAGVPSAEVSWAFLLQGGLVPGSWLVPVSLAAAGMAAAGSIPRTDVLRAETSAAG